MNILQVSIVLSIIGIANAGLDFGYQKASNAGVPTFGSSGWKNNKYISPDFLIPSTKQKRTYRGAIDLGRGGYKRGGQYLPSDDMHSSIEETMVPLFARGSSVIFFSNFRFELIC